MAMIYEEEGYAIRGAVIEVAKTLGVGFAEEVYQEALEMELSERGVPFASQPELSLTYKGRSLRKTYRPDLVCYGKIVVELKAVRALAPEHESQIINYLKATGMHLGLLVNFGSWPKADIRSFVLGTPQDQPT